MKVLILGASGIVGSSMRLCVPPGIEPIWHRKAADAWHFGTDLENGAVSLREWIEKRSPVGAVVYLAGECDVDTVQKNPRACRGVNVSFPGSLSTLCGRNGSHLIYASSQAVLGGPVNEYGIQKLAAEKLVAANGDNWTIARLTFVLGIRPMPHQGRKNPLEAMLDGSHTKQVADRWFSPLFARDAAKALWRLVIDQPKRKIVHIGTPIRVSRYDISVAAGVPCEAVSHDSFTGLAPRPLDTTYPPDSLHYSSLEDGLKQAKQDYEDRQQMNVADRAREIALFLGRREDECLAKLSRGFIPLHHEVTADFKAANIGDDDAKLLEWYRTTEAYIWELSAYHTDPGYNYAGKCQGIAEALVAKGCKTVLCLGDGIGDLTLALLKAGLHATYHDLAGSRTYEFARFRFSRHGRPPTHLMTAGWEPDIAFLSQFDAVVSLDFLEHVCNVESWVAAIHGVLKPGGWFVAQNAFNCGSGPDGSIPMHLSRNDKYEQLWDPTLEQIGFRQHGPNWYQRPVGVEVAA